MAVAYSGLLRSATAPPRPFGRPIRTGHSNWLRLNSARPANCATPPVKTIPAGRRPS